MFPHHADGEGHFAVLLRKGGNAGRTINHSPKKQKCKPNKQAPASAVTVEKASALFDTFCRDVLGHKLSGIPHLFGEMLYLLPDVDGFDASLLDGLRVLRAGLQVGSVHGGRFDPSHSLALALHAQACNHCFELDDLSGQTAAYLHGEEIPCDAAMRSWHLVTLHGFPIGWGKASGGMMKNHYPKGLRKP